MILWIIQRYVFLLFLIFFSNILDGYIDAINKAMFERQCFWGKVDNREVDANKVNDE